MDKLPRVGKKWNRAIERWLKYSRGTKSIVCPFNLRSHRNDRKCLKNYCGKLFPRTREALEIVIELSNSSNISLQNQAKEIDCCPCNLYTTDYVSRVARRYLKETKDANTRGK